MDVINYSKIKKVESDLLAHKEDYANLKTKYIKDEMKGNILQPLKGESIRLEGIDSLVVPTGITRNINIVLKGNTEINGNNIIPTHSQKIQIESENLFDKRRIIEGYWLDGSGNLKVGASYFISANYIKVKPLTTYNTSSQMLSVCEYDRNKLFIKTTQSGNSFTTSENTEYVRVSNQLSRLDSFMVKEGTSSIYVPYKESNLYIELLEPLYSLENGTVDVVNFQKGEVTRNIKLYILKSNDVTSLSTTDENYDTVRIDKISDMWMYGNTSTSTENMQSITIPGYTATSLYNIFINSYYNVGGGAMRLAVPKGTFIDLADAKNKLSGTEILYQSKTPYFAKFDVIGELNFNVGDKISTTPCIFGYIEGSNTKIITNESLPISNINKVIRYDIMEGEIKEVDVTGDCTNDDTSITIANFDNSKVYFYDCDVKEGYSTNAYQVIDFELSTEDVLGIEGETALIKKGDTIYIRANFDDNNDIIHKWYLTRESGNRSLNLDGIYTINKSSDLENTDGSLWKSAGDDICPLNFTGISYIGGNHGYNYLYKLTATAHGKAIQDVGSVWKDANNKEFILYSVIDENTIGILSEFTGDLTSPSITLSSTGTLTHVLGATNATDVIYSARTTNQLYPTTNRNTVILLVDGNEVSEDGIYVGDKVEVVESYNIMYIPALLEYLKSNVGSAEINYNNTSINGWVTVNNIYSHYKNGSMTISASVTPLEDTMLQFWGVTQSMSIGSKAYVPGVGIIGGLDLSNVVTQGVDTLTFTSDTWLDVNKPPYRYHQFNTDLSKGMAIGYIPKFGFGKTDIRKEITHAGSFNGSTGKMYPNLYKKDNTTIGVGDYIEGVAFRVPLRNIDSEATCLYWFWLGNDVYLAFDYHTNINKFIKLPNYLIGKKIEVIDKHENTKVISDFVNSNGIRVSIINNYGYGFIKLYD